MKQCRRILVIGILCLFLAGCKISEKEEFWIRENIPSQTTVTTESIASIQTEATQLPDRLQMDMAIREEELCFCADAKDLLNDVGFYLQRQLKEDLWLPETEAPTPYSRTPATYRRLDFDPMLKNEPMLCVYTAAGDELYEVSAILLTHDWTEAGEANFLQLGKILLRCFWPDCEEDIIADAVLRIREDINQNVYPDNSAIPQPMTVYVHGSAAAYGYTHAAHISINVMPVEEVRLQELKTTGVAIVYIP